MLAVASAISSVLMPIMMAFCPESPIFLISKYGLSGSDRALSSLRRLRKKEVGNEIDAEFEAIARQVYTSDPASSSLSDTLRSLTEARFYKPLILSLLLMAFQQFAGINVVIFYQLDIFKESGSQLNPHLCEMITGFVLFVATIFGMSLMDRFGRKPLLITSGIGMSASLLALGLYFQKIDAGELPHHTVSLRSSFGESYGWISLVSLVSYLTFFSIGFGPIPWMLVPELTPSSGRNLVAALSACLNWSLAFLIIKEFEEFENLVGKAGAFYSFTGLAGLSCIFVALAVPETRGKSLTELEQLF